MMNMVEKGSPFHVKNVDIHVINSCNLRCNGCNHLADYGYGGVFSETDLVEWIKPWKERLFFNRISLLGGEPLLNPNLREICIAYRKLFPENETKIRVITNGLLIHKRPWLQELIQEHDIHIQLSLHVLNGKRKNDKMIDLARRGTALLEKWAGERPRPADYKWGRPVDAKEKLNFQVFYKGAGAHIKPFNLDEIEKSKKHCTCKTLQLYKHHLYKCAPIAYLGEALAKVGLTDDPDWRPYLDYTPAPPGCSEDALRRFMQKQPGPDWTCNMCPPFSNVMLSSEREIRLNE
ncbi:MAG: radical SAM protein [Desulfobacterales bacterium]|nr:radical SAM protein [Desulfobacterales bacterium]